MGFSSEQQLISPLSGITNVDSLVDQQHLTYNYEIPYKTSLTYTFDTASNVATPTPLITMTDSQKTSVRQALAYISSVTGIVFSEQASGTTDGIVFAYYSAGPRNAGVDYSTSSATPDGMGGVNVVINDTIMLNVNNAQQVDPSPGTDGWVTILHEVGHALGLKHPFEGSPVLPTVLDNEAITVMSYTPVSYHPLTYGPIDIQALNWLYGGDGLLGNYGLTIDASGEPVARPAPDFADPFGASTSGQGALSVSSDAALAAPVTASYSQLASCQADPGAVPAGAGQSLASAYFLSRQDAPVYGQLAA